ncbi:MAG: accessory gene regulator B family protein [Ruminococcus sp.]|nr:accessory gene regulator B family protein [Ruminococcus sp.]
MTLSRKITDFVCGTECTDENERSVIEFGVGIMLTKSANIITEIIVGCLFSMLTETIIFLIAFSFLRSYSGGSHSSSSFRCYLSSTAIVACSLLVIKYIDNFCINCIFILSGALLCMALAPVGSRNKPLDTTEKAEYRRKALLILLMILTVSAVSLLINADMVFRTLSVVLAVEGIMLVEGIISLKAD